MPQLRLDFDTFIITGPSTSTDTVTTLVKNSGVVGGKLGQVVPVSAAGQCLTDRFSVTNAGGPSPPVICGTNTAEHSEMHLPNPP